MSKIFAILTAGLFFVSGLAGFIPSAAASDDVSSEVTPKEMQRIKPKELKVLLDQGETVLIVDVRSENAFKKQHIAGAMSVPLNSVETRLSALPAETKIVFY